MEGLGRSIDDVTNTMAGTKKFLTRRKFLATVGLAGLGGVSYVRWVEPHWLGVGRHEIKLSKTAGQASLKILQLSDLHASPFVSLSFIDDAIQLGLAQKPDLICLTGDFISRKYAEFESYAKVLSPLAKAVPTFACLGNHDGGSWSGRRRGYEDTSLVRQLLAHSGVELLHNRAKDVRIKDWNLRLAGLGDLWAGEFQPETAFAGTISGEDKTVVVLSHNPDSKTELKPYPWDLVLCGHTHGGQMRLPFLGTPFAPVRDMNFVEGLHRWNERWIHITRGVGNLHGVRFNCPPEVSLITLI